METAEQIDDVEAASQEDYQLMNMIKNIKDSSRQEVATEIQEKDARVSELEEKLLQKEAELAPLRKFAPILDKTISEPMTVRIYSLTDAEKEQLLVLARQIYPRMSAKFDGGGGKGDRDPVNQMISDLLSFLLIGNVNQCMLLSMFKDNKQRGLQINDGVGE